MVSCAVDALSVSQGDVDERLLWDAAGNYEGAVESSNSAEAITSVLYPNDHT